MSLLKLRCPECNAGLKSPTGFTAGQTVCCPKCETYFAVEEPEEEEEPKPAPGKKKPVKAVEEDEEEDEEDEKPKKKKKKRSDDDEEGSYKTSPLRFVILGVLLLVMFGLGGMLIVKKRSEAEQAKKRDEEAAAAAAAEAARDRELARPMIQPNRPLPKANPNGGKGGALGGNGAGSALGGLLNGATFLTPEQTRELIQKNQAKLIGSSWVADLGGNTTEELIYKTDGTFTVTRTGSAPETVTGKYVVKGLANENKNALKIQLDTATGPRTITAIFEDDELLHPSLEQSVTGVFRKK